ncbi:MAG: P-loop NTPase fold protein [Pseudonocardiaceae bacterium]
MSAVRHPDGRDRLIAAGSGEFTEGWGISQFSAEGKLELVYNRLIHGLHSVPVVLPDGRTLVVTEFAAINPWQEVETFPMRSPGMFWSLTVVRLRDGRIAVVGGGPYGELTLWDIQADFNYDEASHIERGGASSALDSWKERREKVLISTAIDQQLYVRALTPIRDPSSDGANFLVSGGNDGFLRARDPNDWSEVRPPCLVCHSGPVTSLAIVTPAGGSTRIFSGDKTGALWEWNASSGDLIRGPLLGHAGIGDGVTAVRSIQAENVVVAGGGSSEILTWTISEGIEPIDRVRCGQEHSPFGGVHDITPVPGAGRTRIVAASQDRKLSLWEWDSPGWNQIGSAKLSSNAHQVLALRLPDGTCKIATLEGDRIRLRPLSWLDGHSESDNLETGGGEPDPHPLIHTWSLRCMEAVRDDDGRDLLCCGRFGGVDIYDPANGTRVRSIEGSSQDVTAIHSWRDSDGSTVIATGNEAGEIMTSNLSTGASLRWVHAHVGAVRALNSVEKEGAPLCLASAGDDGVISLWDPAAFDRLAVGTIGFSDQPAQIDLLHRRDIVDVLSELLLAGGPPSEPFLSQDPGPTVISVEGAWGSGKTTLMRLLKNKIGSRLSGDKNRVTAKRLTPARAIKILNHASKEENLAELNTRRARNGNLAIWFDPWAHQSGEQIWAGLAQAIMKSAKPVLYPDLNSSEQYWYRRNVGRVDGQAVSRKLRRGAVSPLFRVGVATIILPVLAQLILKLDAKPLDLRILGLHLNKLMAVLLFLIPSVLFVCGFVHSLARYYWGRAASILDPALVVGPLQPADPTVLRDPFYGARSGYLYLVQHDVEHILANLAEQGYTVIVFIDDLDRCAPPMTAAVFEAINLFLSGMLPPARFVIGLDPAVIAEHINQSYTEFQDLPASRHPGDPSLGWTFLRKLIQLSVPLPIPADDKVASLLEGMLGKEESVPSRPTERTEVPRATEPNRSVDVGSMQALRDEGTDLRSFPRRAPAAQPPSGPLPPSDQYRDTPRSIVKQTVGMLERNPDVRSVFQDVIAGLPDWNAREVKRLVNTWQYCARVIERRQPAEGDEAIERAKNLVILSEILTRWPAYVRTFGRRIDGFLGMHALAAAAVNNSRWNEVVHKLGLQSVADLEELRGVLRKQGGLVAANLFEVLYRV